MHSPVRFGSRHRGALLLAGCAAAAILGGCSGSGTQLVNMWRDPTASATPLHRVLVVAVRNDPVKRRIWEDGFVAGLAKHGVEATPSYQLFPNAVPDTDAVVGAVREHNFDGVLVTHRLPTTTQQTYVPGYSRLEPVWVRSRWYGTYHAYWQEVHEPGYVETDQVVRNQVDVWNTADDGRLIWSGTTESINPGSSAEVNSAITKLIVPELLAQGVIAR
jgi:hypothetical protein